jgi:SAM-dependent methyltransferase
MSRSTGAPDYRQARPSGAARERDDYALFAQLCSPPKSRRTQSHGSLPPSSRRSPAAWSYHPEMTPGERWLTATWPLVRNRLPPAPARVLDIGCGPLGGFVPMLRSDGYDASGIDPEAPDESHYQRVEFEDAELPRKVDAVIASTSLHHVASPAEVIERITTTLTRGGAVLVVEWAWENFDAETAEWCFERLGPTDEAGWLHHRRDEWVASGQGWSTYLQAWAARAGIHRGERLLRLLDERLERRLLTYGPYYFPDLVATTEAEEQAAIDAGQIQASRIDYVGSFVENNS